jgi:hypothetical protein
MLADTCAVYRIALGLQCLNRPMTYQDFLDQKLHAGAAHGFEPIWMPPQLFDFQQSLVTWAIRKGRAAIFADCGLGKTAMQLTWAENVVRHTNKPVLILTPLGGCCADHPRG